MKTILASLLLLLISFPAVGQDKKEPRKKREEPGLEGLKALRNEDPEVRYKAAAVMVRLGPVAKFASKELREAFRDETNLEVKVKLAEAIWAVERPVASVLTPFLMEALAQKDDVVRVGAAGVLGQMGTKAKAAIPHLVKRVKDKELPVRIAAVLALGEIGPTAKDAAEPLLAAIVDKEDPILDSMIGISLGKMGPGVIPLLQKTVEEASFRRQLAAAYALGEIGPAAKDTVPALQKLLKDDGKGTNQIVLQALGKIGKEANSATTVVEPFLKSKNASLRLEAALALYLIGGQTAHLPIIREYLSDEKAGMQYEASLAIKHYGMKGKEAAPDLHKLLTHKDFKVRMASALALWSVTGEAEETLKLYESTIDNSDNDIRSRTLEHLTEMGEAARPLLPLIQEAARDEDDLVRNLARGLLAKLTPP